jgi:CHAT domain-containing protein
MLPFAALPKPVVGSQWPAVAKNQPPALDHQPLIVAHEITYLPSASSLKLLRENRVQPPAPRGWFARWRHSLRSWLGRRTEAASLRSVAVLADPVFEKDDKRVEGQTPSAAQINESQRREVDLSNENIFLPRLFATLAEAAEIQKAAGPNPVLLKHGFAVNRALLASEELHPYGIIHFATHGFWDSRNPEMSGLFLSRFDQQGNKLDGTLRLSDVYNLILPKELVVLSACETAVGKDIRGEGLIALTRGFMYAGAARVMASLWKVDDAATAEMMKIFYQHLLQDQMTPAAALRQAQIAMWQKDAAAVPYHWAAFILQGEYR